MEYRKLGQSDLEVPAVIFGAWAVGGWWWGGSDDDKAVDAIRAAVDAGITCIDTAPIYGMGHSEKVVGRAIEGIRDRVIVATKCGLGWETPDGRRFIDTDDVDGDECEIYRTLKRDSIVKECEGSLRRLGVEVIDLYQCHWPDEDTPVEETMEALTALQEQGKIRAIGVSNFTPEMIETCMNYGVIASDQPRYNLLGRNIEKDILPFCREHKVGVICYSPMDQGLLTGKVSIDREFAEGDKRANKPWFQPKNRKRILEALDKIKPIADGYGATLAQLAVNWVISQPGVTSAIVGARTPEQARENAGAADFKMTQAELQQIRQVFEDLGGPEK